MRVNLNWVQQLRRIRPSEAILRGNPVVPYPSCNYYHQPHSALFKLRCCVNTAEPEWRTFWQMDGAPDSN
jgi:hypothetical protein